MIKSLHIVTRLLSEESMRSYPGSDRKTSDGTREKRERRTLSNKMNISEESLMGSGCYARPMYIAIISAEP